MSIIVPNPFAFFTDRRGAPLEGGYIYIGAENQNPQTNPISVYWDIGGTIPAQQPLRTTGGYIYRNGTPANVFVNTDCSITVRDSSGALVYTNPSVPTDQSSDLSFIQAGTGAVVRTAQNKMREIFSVADFGAVGDGSTDNSAAFQLAIDAAAATGKPCGVLVPNGTWRIDSEVAIQSNNVELFGNGRGSLVTLYVDGAIKVGGAVASTLYSGVRGLAIGAASGITADAMVTFTNTGRCYIESVFFQGHRKVAIQVGDSGAGNAAPGTRVINCGGVPETNATDAVLITGPATGDIVISGLNFNGVADQDGAILRVAGLTGSVDGLIVENIFGTQFDYGVLVDVGSGSGLSNCNFTGGTLDCGGSLEEAFYITAAGGAVVQNVNVTGLEINAAQDVGSNFAVRLSTDATAVMSDIKFNGNTIKDSRGGGILVSAGAAGMERISIVGNSVFDGNRAGANTDGIEVAGPISGLVIVANTITNDSTTWRHGINISAATFPAKVPVIQGNYIDNVSGNPINNSAASANYSTIYGNAGATLSPQLVQAWVTYNLNTSTLLDSYNVSGVVKDATGQITITLANNVSAANCALAIVCQDLVGHVQNAPSTGGVTVRTTPTNSVTLTDTPYVSVTFFARRVT